MLYLHVSNRTENLLRHLAEVLRVSGRRQPFAKEILLIQSQGMERMISQALATSFGSWCNFAYFLPLGFLQYSARLLGMEITPDGWDRRTMTWRLEYLLRDLTGEEYSPVRNYLLGESGAVKRYQLAEQLANIFDQYQLMRPEMLSGWSRGRLVSQEEHERWQQSLWRKLQAQQAGAPHRGEMLGNIIAKLQAGDDLAAILPERISVFGLSILPPLFLKYLQGLGNHCDVHLYVLSPCSEYWGDLELRRGQLLAGVDLMADEPQAMDHGPERHPLLRAYGRQGRDFQRLLFGDQIRFTMEFASYTDPLNDGQENLLRRLQSDLLRGDVTWCSERWDEHDRSIHVVSCHSRLREITVLKEHILHWLYQDPALQLRDIVVMAPDIQQYAALIPAVFDTIQHAISDRSLRRRNSILAAFADFLALFQGRFCWDEMFDLLREPVVAGQLELSRGDLDNLQRWVTEAGVRWGLSGEQRRASGLPAYGETSWQDGLSRLLMGYTIDSDEFVAGILPYTDIEGSGAAALGGLCRFVSLVEEARRDFGLPRSLAVWSALLGGYADRLFQGEAAGGANRDFLELQEIITELGEVPGEFHQGSVEFRVVASWLENTARETRSSSGFLRGQLTFCSMLPMRSIPFRKVCLIGLNDTAFPHEDRYATFDLLGKSHRPGDRSRRMDDRYQFLEAIMAARDQLYLSFIGQSIKNNEEIPPSVVVTELLEVLEGCYKATHLLVRHPLHPFSSRYFSGATEALFSYDEKSCQVAQALRSGQHHEESWWRGTRSVELAEIAVRDLFAFYRNPQRWFVRDCLGIRLTTDFDSVSDSEPFSQDGLENYQVNQELLKRLLAGDDPASFGRKLQVMAHWPLGEPGRVSFTARVKELERFASLVTGLGMGRPCAELEVDLLVGDHRLVGRLGNIHERGILLYRYGRIGGRELVGGWLHYLLYERLTGNPVEVVLLGKDECYRFGVGSALVPDLETMVAVFVDGCRQPSQLYLEPGVAWVKKTDRDFALEAAHAALAQSLENGWEPETALLLRGCDPAAVLGEGFVEMMQTLLEPILRRAYGR